MNRKSHEHHELIFITDMLLQLGRLAEVKRLDMLVYLIGIAAAEAKDIIAEKESSPKR